MGYYIIAVIAALMGFFACAVLSSAGKADRSCSNCRHHRKVPEDVPDWLGKGYVVCVACRGVDYEIPQMLQSISLAKPEGCCDEFQPEEGEGG